MSDFEDGLRRRLRDYAAQRAPAVDPSDIVAAATRPAERRTWPRLLAAAAVIVLAIVGTTAGLSAIGHRSGVGSSPTAAPTLPAAATNSPSGTPSANASASVVVPQTLDLSTIAFRRVVSPTVSDANARIRLDIGTLDGASVQPIWFPPGMPLRLAAFGALNPVVAAGPVQDNVIYVKNTDPAEIHLVNARTGSDELLLEDDAGIWSVAIAPDATRAYLLRVSRSNADFLSVDSISLADPSDRRTLIASPELASARGPIQLAVAAPFWAQLLADDHHLVAVVCRDQHCLMPVVDLGSREVIVRGNISFGESLVGLLPDTAIGSGGENGFQISLADGSRTPLLDNPVVVIETPDGPGVLAGSEDGEGSYRVEKLNLETGEQSTAATLSFVWGETYQRLIDPLSDIHAELPAGWALVSEGVDAAPAPPPKFSAVSVDGHVVPLPILGRP
jgi:hypothetical protein